MDLSLIISRVIFMSSFLLTTYKSYSETKTNTEEKYKIKIEKQRRLRCAEQSRLR